MEFECYYPNCPRSYNSKYNLKRHINTNHLHLKSYPCDQCEKNFASKKNLLKHSSTHNPVVLQEIPIIIKNKIKIENSSRFDLKSIPLSLYYTDIILQAPVNPILSKQTLPSLPPIDLCRQEHQLDIRVPLLPILLNYATRN
jgi:Zinc finger, C2H2 type/C2H2-type zinc finger